MFVFLAVTKYKELSVFLNVVYAYTFPTSSFSKNFPLLPFLSRRSPIFGLIMDESFTLTIHEIGAREMAQWVKCLQGKHEDQLSRREIKQQHGCP